MKTFQSTIEGMKLSEKFSSIGVCNLVFISERGMKTFNKNRRVTKLSNSFEILPCRYPEL